MPSARGRAAASANLLVTLREAPRRGDPRRATQHAARQQGDGEQHADDGAERRRIRCGYAVQQALNPAGQVSGLLYRVSPFDPVALTAAAVVLSTAAMLACYLPARRATRVVTLEALRSE